MLTDLGCVWLESHESGVLFQFFRNDPPHLEARTEWLQFSVWLVEYEGSHDIYR
jgi:hypothetical protein